MEYEFLDTGYGKSLVKLLHVKRDGIYHSIREFEVSTQLSLQSKKDYTKGDNEDVVATDSQKNTVYLLAKNHGVNSPEGFALLLCNHFLSRYSHVTKAMVHVEVHPWKRVIHAGQEHNHAFVSTPINTNFCSVTQERGALPRIESGLKGLRLLKTTQSSFVKFVDDEFRSLPDMDDRIFSTEVSAHWEYFTTKNLDFEKAREFVKDTIIDNFSGPPEKGTYSPSVQNTLYISEKEILDKVPQISNIEMDMPNKHYFEVDLSKFPRLGVKDNKEVYLPVDKPSGYIRCKLGRKFAKL